MTLEKIHENMRIKNMTVASLSRETGLAYSTVYDIVHGNTDLAKCTCETIEKLDTALALSEFEELTGIIRGPIFENHFTTGLIDEVQSQKRANELSAFFASLMMAVFASANIPVNTRLEPILNVKAEDIDFTKGEQTFFCLLEDAYFENQITKKEFASILLKACQRIESLDLGTHQKFPYAKYEEGFSHIRNAAYYMDDIIRMPQITQTMEMEDTERWKKVQQITKGVPLTMIKGFAIMMCYKTSVFQGLFDFLLTERYNPRHTKEQRDELYCLDLFRGDAKEFIRRVSMVCMDSLGFHGYIEDAFVFWWEENNVLLHAACVETGRGIYFTEAADDSIAYEISIHDQTKQNTLLGYMPREVIEQRSGFEDVCSPYMEKLIKFFKGDGYHYAGGLVWNYISDAPRTELRTYLFSIAEIIAKKDGIAKAGEWMSYAFSIWQYARLFPEDVQILVEEYLHMQQDKLTEDMNILEGMLFASAAVPYKDTETKKWYARTVDGEISEMGFPTKKDVLLYIRDSQRDLRTQLRSVLEAVYKDNKKEVHFRERSMYSYWAPITEIYGPEETAVLAAHLIEHGVPVRKKKNGTVDARKYEYSDIDALEMRSAVENFFMKHFPQEKNSRYQPDFRLQGTYTAQDGSSVCVFRCFREYEQKATSKELWDAGYHVDILKPGLVMVWQKNTDNSF